MLERKYWWVGVSKKPKMLVKDEMSSPKSKTDTFETTYRNRLKHTNLHQLTTYFG